MPFKFNPFTKKPDIVDVETIPPGAVSGLAGDSGGSVSPDGSGDINIVGSGDIDVVGTPVNNTLTVSYSGDPIDFLAGDSGGNIGPNVSGVVTLAGGTDIGVTGAGNTLTIDFTGTQATAITPFVVGATGNYASIGAAITAASAGDTIYIQPGTYTENINFNSKVGIFYVGLVSTNLGLGVILNGNHTPPASGNNIFQNIYFANSSANATFASNSAGSPTIQFFNCSFDNSTTPHLFDDIIMTPVMTFVNCRSLGGVNGFLRVGAGTCNIQSCNVGGTSGADDIAGATFNLYNSVYLSSLSFTSTSTVQIYNSNLRFVSFNNGSTGSIYNTSFESGAVASITMSSSGAWNISNCMINSSNDPCIAGSGSGSLNLNNISFLDNKNISNSLNIGSTSSYQGNTSVNTLENTQFFTVGANDSVEPVGLYRWGGSSGAGSSILTYRARGTELSPSAVSSGDVLSGWYCGGYDSTGFNSFSTAIRSLATENFSVGANGARLDFQITPDGSASRSTRMRIESNGNISMGIGIPSSSAILHLISTTQGLRLPVMNTTQKNNIVSPASGLIIFDTTLGKMCVYTGSAWQTVTST